MVHFCNWGLGWLLIGLAVWNELGRLGIMEYAWNLLDWLFGTCWKFHPIPLQPDQCKNDKQTKNFGNQIAAVIDQEFMKVVCDNSNWIGLNY